MAKEINMKKQKEILEEFEKENRTRNFINPILKKIFEYTALITIFYHLVYASGYFRPETLRHRSIHVGMILLITFISYPLTKKSSRENIPWYDYILMGLSVIIPVYMWVNYQSIIERVGDANTLDVIVGTILVVLVLEAARRITGLSLPIIGIIFILYSIIGKRQGIIPVNIPGIFMHRGFQWAKIIGHLFANTEGIYGTSVNVASTYIFLFIVFGEIMNKSGMGKFLNDISIGLAGNSKGGPAKVAVIASGFLGSINGSAVANVVTTGAFTIPLMKKVGYSKEFSGAVESTASVGGQLLPPIMGAAAFIMAETLGIQYKVIAISAAIPAILYYLGIIFQVQLKASKDNLGGIEKENLPSIPKTLKIYWHLLIPIIFLVYMLFFSGTTVIRGALFTIVLTIIVAQLKKETRMSLKDLESAFINSTKSTVATAVACACVGIVIGISSLTGFTINLASTIISLGNTSLLLTLLFTMISCMLLGMGLPSIPAYIITSTIAAPALIKLGIAPLAAHLFCFYFAMFANITPPVALASFAAAGISGGDPMKTGIKSVKLALAGFIIPYMFVYNNQLLLIDTNILKGIQVFITACIGVFFISTAVEGYLYRKLSIFMRIFIILSAFLLINSSTTTDIIGIILFVSIVIMEKIISKKEIKNKIAV